jgi:hypothetical protein
MPEWPGLVLLGHVMDRTAAIGGGASSLYAVKRYFSKDRVLGRSFLAYTLPKQCFRGSLLGAVIGAGMTAARCSSLTDEEVIDRCECWPTAGQAPPLRAATRVCSSACGPRIPWPSHSCPSCCLPRCVGAWFSACWRPPLELVAAARHCCRCWRCLLAACCCCCLQWVPYLAQRSAAAVRPGHGRWLYGGRLPRGGRA